MTVSTPTLVFLVLVSALVAGIAVLLVWKLTKLALKAFLVGGLLLLLSAAAAVVFLGSRR